MRRGPGVGRSDDPVDDTADLPAVGVAAMSHHDQIGQILGIGPADRLLVTTPVCSPMLVEDVMETDLVTCDADATLREAVGRMLEAHVGSVIVTVEENPAGILTETDTLEAGYVTGQPFGDIPVQSVASESLVTIEPTRTIRAAIQQMVDNEVKKLPVVENLELVGILTMTDVTRHYGDIVREIHEIEQPRRRRSEWAGATADDGTE